MVETKVMMSEFPRGLKMAEKMGDLTAAKMVLLQDQARADSLDYWMAEQSVALSDTSMAELLVAYLVDLTVVLKAVKKVDY